MGEIVTVAGHHCGVSTTTSLICATIDIVGSNAGDWLPARTSWSTGKFAGAAPTVALKIVAQAIGRLERRQRTDGQNDCDSWPGPLARSNPSISGALEVFG